MQALFNDSVGRNKPRVLAAFTGFWPTVQRPAPAIATPIATFAFLERRKLHSLARVVPRRSWQSNAFARYEAQQLHRLARVVPRRSWQSNAFARYEAQQPCWRPLVSLPALAAPFGVSHGQCVVKQGQFRQPVSAANHTLGHTVPQGTLNLGTRYPRVL